MLTEFAVAHPFICLTVAAYVFFVLHAWAFLAGAARLNEEPRREAADGERTAHRAAVEAGYASFDGYVAKYGRGEK